MTIHNESGHDSDGSANAPAAAEADSPEGVSPPERVKAPISEAEKIIREAGRVEAEAEALIAEALQYQQDILKRLQVCFEPLNTAGDADSADNSKYDRAIAAGYMAEAMDTSAAQTSDAGQPNLVSPFIEAMRMGNTNSTKTELVEQILAGSAGIKAAEAAIQCAFEVFMNEAANQMSILVKNNTLYPEIREDMLKLEKRVMAMTLEAIDSIQARVPEPPNPKAKSDT